MFQNASRAKGLLQAVENGELRLDLLDQEQRETLLKQPDEAIRVHGKALWEVIFPGELFPAKPGANAYK